MGGSPFLASLVNGASSTIGGGFLYKFCAKKVKALELHSHKTIEEVETDVKTYA